MLADWRKWMKRKRICITVWMVVLLTFFSVEMTVYAGATGTQSAKRKEDVISERTETQNGVASNMPEQFDEKTVEKEVAEELLTYVMENVETDEIIEHTQNAIKKSFIESIKNFFEDMIKRLKGFWENVFS